MEFHSGNPGGMRFECFLHFTIVLVPDFYQPVFEPGQDGIVTFVQSSADTVFEIEGGLFGLLRDVKQLDRVVKASGQDQVGFGPLNTGHAVVVQNLFREQFNRLIISLHFLLNAFLGGVLRSGTHPEQEFVVKGTGTDEPGVQGVAIQAFNAAGRACQCIEWVQSIFFDG